MVGVLLLVLSVSIKCILVLIPCHPCVIQLFLHRQVTDRLAQIIDKPRLNGR